MQNLYGSFTDVEMEEDCLRTEVEHELLGKKQCTYQPYECSQLCLDGYKFCSKHILQDKNAPYKQCSYIYSSNGKRCNLAAPRSDKKDYGYCSEHALKATLARNRQNSKHPLPQTAEVLLSSLSHYVKKPRIRTNSSSTHHSDDGDRASPDIDQKSAKCLDPFVDVDAAALYNGKCNQVLDVCSESESDVEASALSSVWQDEQADSSNDESTDSENEDPLKHANVYTAEEVTLMTRDKLIRLQSLYIEQYRHLQYLLTKKRRKYLHSLKREKETCCNIYNQVRDNPKEQRLYKKLKALNNYQRCHGVDAILNKRLKDLRGKVTDGSASKSQTFSKCLFTEGGVKCGERSLPLAKHCQKHILEDMNQVLFRACGKIIADVECTTPIAAIFDESTCPLHLEIPPLRSYHQIRKDSESDVDETIEHHLSYKSSPQMAEPIKTEFMSYEIPPEIPKMESVPTMLFEENPEERSESTSTNPFIFGLSSKNLSEENEKMKLEAKKAEECAENMMQLSRYVADQMQQPHNMEIKRETTELQDVQNVSNEEVINTTEVVDKKPDVDNLDNSEKIDTNDDKECETVAPVEELSLQPEGVEKTITSEEIVTSSIKEELSMQQEKTEDVLATSQISNTEKNANENLPLKRESTSDIEETGIAVTEGEMDIQKDVDNDEIEVNIKEDINLSKEQERV